MPFILTAVCLVCKLYFSIYDHHSSSHKCQRAAADNEGKAHTLCGTKIMYLKFVDIITDIIYFYHIKDLLAYFDFSSPSVPPPHPTRHRPTPHPRELQSE